MTYALHDKETRVSTRISSVIGKVFTGEKKCSWHKLYSPIQIHQYRITVLELIKPNRSLAMLSSRNMISLTSVLSQFEGECQESAIHE
jgi:hypothetical protein